MEGTNDLPTITPNTAPEQHHGPAHCHAWNLGHSRPPTKHRGVAAMANTLRIAFVSAVLLLVVGCGNALAPDAGGDEIYRVMCAQCHGDELEGGTGPALGPGSAAAASPDEDLLAVTRRGQGTMPAYELSLDGSQMDRLLVFLREQQAGGS